MRTVTLALLTLALVASAANAADLTSWTLWSRDADNSVEQRIGLDTDPVEFGVLSRWWPIDETPQVAGAYVFLHLPQPIEVSNPFKDIIPGLPESFFGYPYGGGSFGVDFLDDDDRSFSCLQAGVLISGEEKKDAAVVLEWARYDFKNGMDDYREDENVWSLGFFLRF